MKFAIIDNKGNIKSHGMCSIQTFTDYEESGVLIREVAGDNPELDITHKFNMMTGRLNKRTEAQIKKSRPPKRNPKKRPETISITQVQWESALNRIEVLENKNEN